MDPMDEDPPARRDNPPPRSSSTSGATTSAVGTKHPAPTPISHISGSAASGAAAASSSPSQPPQGAFGVSKRRRGLGIVTPNACTECRKKRAKVSVAAFASARRAWSLSFSALFLSPPLLLSGSCALLLSRNDLF